MLQVILVAILIAFPGLVTYFLDPANIQELDKIEIIVPGPGRGGLDTPPAFDLNTDRAEPLRDYCLGLMMPLARKSVEPLAAVTAPARVSAQHQSLLHFVGQAPWSDEVLIARVRDWVLPRMIERGGEITAWIVDDTGFPKKGRHSVGVARQYCGQLGKQDNCQVAVSLSIANETASLPIAWRLYLPELWAQDPELRRKAKVPVGVGFQTKPQIALDQVRAAVAAGTPAGVILADAGYGADGAFRSGLSQLGLDYVVGVQPTLSVWRPGEGPLPPKAWGGTGRPPSRMRRGPEHNPLSAKALAQDLPAEAWHSITWREGSNVDLASRFAAAARPTRFAGLQSHRAAPRGMAADRVAQRRCRAAQILAVHASGGHAAARSRGHGQAPLAHRAGLSRAQAGAWPGPL